jgi:two-component system sensor histidine kinase PilS (NtrC family)
MQLPARRTFEWLTRPLLFESPTGATADRAPVGRRELWVLDRFILVWRLVLLGTAYSAMITGALPVPSAWMLLALEGIAAAQGLLIVQQLFQPARRSTTREVACYLILDWIWFIVASRSFGSISSAWQAELVVCIAIHARMIPGNGAAILDLIGILLYYTAWRVDIVQGPDTAFLGQIFLYGILIWYLANRVGSSMRARRDEIDRLEHRFLRYSALHGALISGLDVGICVLDAHDRIDFASAATFPLLGFAAPPDEHGFWPRLAATNPEASAILRAAHTRALSGVGGTGLVTLAPMTGEVRAAPVLRFVARPLPLDAWLDDVPAVSFVFADAADEIDRAHYVRQSARGSAVAELAASMAHELRNPLTSIRTAAEMLARPQAPAGGTRDRLLQVLLRESARLHRLLTDFLQFAHVPRQVTPQAVNLGAVCAAVIAAEEPTAALRFVRIVHEADIGVPEILADGELVHRALANLLNNAVRHAPDGSAVVVRIALHDESRAQGALARGAVAVSISDHGPGLPEQVRAHLGQPFVSDSVGGTGLGLSVAFRVAALHGGSLLVTDAATPGTCFTLILPLSPTLNPDTTAIAAAS